MLCPSGCGNRAGVSSKQNSEERLDVLKGLCSNISCVLDTVMQAYVPSTWKLEAGQSEVQGSSSLNKEFENQPGFHKILSQKQNEKIILVFMTLWKAFLGALLFLDCH